MRHRITTFAMIAALAAPCFGQQQPAAPAGDAEAKAIDVLIRRNLGAAEGQVMAAGGAAPVRTETVSFVGVSTSPAPAVLTEQLRQTRGLGLVVDFVEPKSPAEGAGVRVYDLLTHLDDQRLANPEQLRTLVRLRKPGEAARLSLIRQGKAETVTVTLGKREEAVAGADAAAMPGMAGRFVNTAIVRPLAAARPGNVVTLRLDGGDGVVAGQVPPGAGTFTVARVDGRVQTVWSDDKHQLRIVMKDGKAAHLNVTDAAGKAVFDGPVETAEQRRALPAEVAEKLKLAEAAGPVNVEVRAAATGAARPRVLTSVVKDVLMVARFEQGKPAYVLAVSQADGKTLFDGPVGSAEQRKGLPEGVAGQLETLEKNQGSAVEFGKM